MHYRTTLEGAIAELSGIPHVVLEAGALLPGRTPQSLKEVEDRTRVRFPEWVAQLYGEVGGAHISWRLSPSGYEELDPGRPDNGHRYDVSGNLDLLPPEEAIDGFTGHGWDQPYEGRAANFRPLDFSSFFVNLGFVVPQSEGDLVLFVLYDNRRFPLAIPLAEYLRLGAELLFMREWQLALLNDKKYIEDSSELRALKSRVTSLPADR